MKWRGHPRGREDRRQHQEHMRSSARSGQDLYLKLIAKKIGVPFVKRTPPSSARRAMWPATWRTCSGARA
jgi:hypothetical protein